MFDKVPSTIHLGSTLSRTTPDGSSCTWHSGYVGDNSLVVLSSKISIIGQASVMMELPAATITDPAACNDIPCICGIVGGRPIRRKTFSQISFRNDERKIVSTSLWCNVRERSEEGVSNDDRWREKSIPCGHVDTQKVITTN